MLPYVLIGMTIGLVVEVCVRLLKLWVYRQPQTPVFNVIVVFGLIMGAIAMLVRRNGLLLPFVIGGGVGLAYEVANLAWLKWWEFPDARLGSLRGHAIIVVVMSLAWGTVPLITAKVQAALPRLPRTAAPQASLLEKLNQREKALIEKLNAVRQREGDLESRLDDLRRRKQILIDKQAARPVEHPGRRGSPTP